MFVRSHHVISVTGKVIKDIELTFDENDEANTRLSIPTNNMIGYEDDKPVYETTWFEVTLKGKDALVAERELQKGDSIQIIGTLRPEPKIRELRDGRTVGIYELIPKEIIYLLGKNGE